MFKSTEFKVVAPIAAASFLLTACGYGLFVIAALAVIMVVLTIMMMRSSAKIAQGERNIAHLEARIAQQKQRDTDNYNNFFDRVNKG